MNQEKERKHDKIAPVIGAGIGVLIGGLVGFTVASVIGVFTGGVSWALTGLLAAGGASAGMLLGMHEFSDAHKQEERKAGLPIHLLGKQGKALSVSHGKSPPIPATNHHSDSFSENQHHTVTAVIYEGYSQHSRSDTYHREKVLASARQALYSMDHTKATPN